MQLFSHPQIYYASTSEHENGKTLTKYTLVVHEEINVSMRPQICPWSENEAVKSYTR